MVLALVTVIDYFSDVVGFASKGAFKAWTRMHQPIARAALACGSAQLHARGDSSISDRIIEPEDTDQCDEGMLERIGFVHFSIGTPQSPHPKTRT